MAIRKVGNIYDGKSGLRKVGNIYDSSVDEKKNRFEEAQARAEAARIEAERLNSFSGLVGETAKGVFGIGKELGKDIVGTTAAIGADFGNVLTPWRKKTESVSLFGNEYVTPSTRGVRSGTLAREGKHKQSLGELGTAGLDIATTFLTPFKGAQVLKGGAFTRGFIQGGTAAAPITAGYGLAGSAIEDKGGLEMAKDTAIAGAAGFAGGGILGGALSKVGSRVAGNPIKDVGDFEVGRIIDDVDKEIGRATTPKEEEEIINLVSRGATRDEIITEVGKAKISEGLNPKVRLSQVVDEIESGGKKLSLEEVATVKKGLEEGKSLEEIQTSLEPQKAPSTTQKKETSTETPDNGDEAFLKSVEERFLASKREKFREATKDKQGRFTGSKSEARMATGDPERDALSESIQKRLDLLGKDDLNKTTRENFYDTSQSLRLEDIQNQIPQAKAEDLPRLKQEADDIIQEILDKRAGEFKAASKREDRVRKAMTIANNSNTPLEFRINLRKEGMDKSFKSQQAAEEFYRRTRGGKYRLADQSDPEQALLKEAKKYKSAEEFVKKVSDTYWSRNKLSDKMYALNKLAKSYRGRYSQAIIDARKDLYNLKDSLVEKYGEFTGETHKFPVFIPQDKDAYFPLYKLGDNTFHIPKSISQERHRIFMDALEGFKKKYGQDILFSKIDYKFHLVKKPENPVVILGEKIGIDPQELAKELPLRKLDEYISKRGKMMVASTVYSPENLQKMSDSDLGELRNLLEKESKINARENLIRIRKEKSINKQFYKRYSDRLNAIPSIEDLERFKKIDVISSENKKDIPLSDSDIEFMRGLLKGENRLGMEESQLTDIWKKANSGKFRLNSQDTEQSLLREAKKYKSAEEFVKAQPNKWLHGTPASFDKFDLEHFGKSDDGFAGKGVYLTNDPKSARYFADEWTSKAYPNKRIGNVMDVYPDIKKPLIVDNYNDIFKKLGIKEEKGLNVGESTKKYKDIIPEKAQNLGYDSIIIRSKYPDGTPADELVVFQTDNIKTKSQLIDIWKKANEGKFRSEFGDRFEQLTGTKITPEQEANIKDLHKKMFGDESVEVTAQILTPNGQKALGEYKSKIIKILDGQADPEDTFYHEAVHKYLDLFTSMDEQKKIYLEARKLWKTDNLDDLEEKIAENFIRYAKTNEGVVGTMKVLFDKVVDRIKSALKGESSIEALYKDILEGKAAKSEKAPITSKELQRKIAALNKKAREKEREMAVIRKGYMSEEKFLAEPQDLIFDETIKAQYDSFTGMLRRFKTGRQREAILSGDVGSIKKALDGKVRMREIDDMFYSQEKSDNEMLDYFRDILEKGKKKVTEKEILSSVESKLKTDPDYIRLQDELGDIRKQRNDLIREEEDSIKSVNGLLDEMKKEPEPIQKTKEATLDASVKQIVPKGKKVSIIAERLNKDLPPDFRIDETYDPKAINKEADKAAELIAKNKTKAIQKALDTETNPMERDAILIELSEIAKRDKDYGTLSDLFNKRSELIRSGAQSLNMEKASILLNPQEKYMRDVVNAKLGKVKIRGKELTLEEAAKKRTGIRKEVNDAVRKSFKIEDAQELFDKLLCT